MNHHNQLQLNSAEAPGVHQTLAFRSLQTIPNNQSSVILAFMKAVELNIKNYH